MIWRRNIQGSIKLQLFRIMAFMAGSASSGKCWWRDCCKASLCQSACCSAARARCMRTLSKNRFIYKWFVISFRLPIWNWSRGHAVCSTKSNLSWTCNQQRRRIFLSTERKRSCVELADPYFSDDRKLICWFANLAKSWQNLDEKM